MALMKIGRYPEAIDAGLTHRRAAAERPARLVQPLALLRPQRPDPGSRGRRRQGQDPQLGREDQEGGVSRPRGRKMLRSSRGFTHFSHPMADPFFITTAIDYTNGAPHIGHAYEKVLADVLARYHRLKGDDVFFLTGVDQHGQKVQQSAEKQGVAPQEFVDGITAKFLALWEKLDVRYDGWAATTDPLHKDCVRANLQKLWDDKDPATGQSRWIYKKNAARLLQRAAGAVPHRQGARRRRRIRPRVAAGRGARGGELLLPPDPRPRDRPARLRPEAVAARLHRPAQRRAERRSSSPISASPSCAMPWKNSRATSASRARPRGSSGASRSRRASARASSPTSGSTRW